MAWRGIHDVQRGKRYYRRGQADPRLGERERRVLRRDGQVTRAHDAHAARAHVPRDPRDDRLGQLHDQPEQGHDRGPAAAELCTLAAAPRAGARGGQVGARAEHPAGVGQYDRPHRPALPASPSRADTSSTSPADSALRLYGESRVTVATSSPASYRTNSLIFVTP